MHSMLTQTTIYKLDLRDDPFCTHPKNIYSVIKYFLPPDTHLYAFQGLEVLLLQKISRMQ